MYDVEGEQMTQRCENDDMTRKVMRQSRLCVMSSEGTMFTKNKS